jgi:hypothetical protein
MATERDDDPIPADECLGFDPDRCTGPVESRPAIRSTNVWLAFCDHHWQEHLARANWDGVLEDQHEQPVYLLPAHGKEKR